MSRPRMITSLLAIDPGACTGYAYFTLDVSGWHLCWAEEHTPDEPLRFLVGSALVVIENPKIYPQGHPRPNNLLTLSRIVGRYQERYKTSQQRLVYPRDWKGSIDGDIMTKRIQNALTPAERALTVGLGHDGIDAVGLGKWSLRQPWMRAGRTEEGR